MAADTLAGSALSDALSGVRVGDNELQFSSAAIFQLFEDLPVAISITVGRQHRFVYANAHYRNGLTAGRDPAGRELGELLGTVLPPRTFALRERVLDEARTASLPEEPIPPLAEVPSNYWDVTFFPLLGESRRPEGVLTFAVDVTERVKGRKEAEQRAEDARRSAEETSLDRARLALAVEATELGIWEWNVETGETIWSDRQKAIWGLDPEHPATFEYWRESIHRDDCDTVLGRVERTMDPESGGDQKLEHRIVRPSGAVRWVASHGRMIYDQRTGRPLRLIGTARDITQRKRREEDLSQALESRDMLLREVNHRIKNSLQIVSSMLSLQSARLTDPDVRALIQEAQHRVHAVAAMHDRLYRSQDFKTVDLAGFLEGLCRDLERTIGDDAAIVLDVVTEPMQIVTDRAVPIALILNELLTNAIKYAYPDGGGTVSVALTRSGQGRGRLAVADGGVGLPAQFVERQHATLGFRIIEGLARQMEGDIEISAGNPGTLIAISFDIQPD